MPCFAFSLALPCSGDAGSVLDDGSYWTGHVFHYFDTGVDSDFCGCYMLLEAEVVIEA